MLAIEVVLADGSVTMLGGLEPDQRRLRPARLLRRQRRHDGHRHPHRRAAPARPAGGPDAAPRLHVDRGGRRHRQRHHRRGHRSRRARDDGRRDHASGRGLRRRRVPARRSRGAPRRAGRAARRASPPRSRRSGPSEPSTAPAPCASRPTTPSARCSGKGGSRRSARSPASPPTTTSTTRSSPGRRFVDVLRQVYDIADRYDLTMMNVFHAGDGNLHPAHRVRPARAGDLGAGARRRRRDPARVRRRRRRAVGGARHRSREARGDAARVQRRRPRRPGPAARRVRPVRARRTRRRSCRAGADAERCSACRRGRGCDRVAGARPGGRAAGDRRRCRRRRAGRRPHALGGRRSDHRRRRGAGSRRDRRLRPGRADRDRRRGHDGGRAGRSARRSRAGVPARPTRTGGDGRRVARDRTVGTAPAALRAAARPLARGPIRDRRRAAREGWRTDGEERHRLRRPAPARRLDRDDRRARAGDAALPAARRVSRWWITTSADPFEARRRMFRPSCIAWDGETTRVLLEGHPDDVAAEAKAAGLETEGSAAGVAGWHASRPHLGAAEPAV